MNLKEANRELEKLENEYEYWLNEKEMILSLVRPQASTIKDVVVQGGTREDRMLKYAESEDEKKINDTLDYIHKRKQNIITWIDNELKILGKYGETEKLIVELKENTRIKDKHTGRYRDMTWDEISKECHYDRDYCRRIYRLYKKKRTIL